MSCNLIRIRCDRRNSGADGKKHELLQPHRLFDVAPLLAEPIAPSFRRQGLAVIEEPIQVEPLCAHFVLRWPLGATKKGSRNSREPLV